jgi:hypothetical protein
MKLFRIPFFLVLFSLVMVKAQSQQTVQAFLESYGTTGVQEQFYKNSVKRSIDGFVYVCGATLNVDGNYDMILSKLTSDNETIWSVTYSGLAGGDDFASDLVIDNSGDIVVTGTEFISTTNYNAVTIKYNSSGIQQWIATYNGPSNSLDGGVSIQNDSNNNIFVCGGSYGANTGSDFLCVKYDDNGIQQWVSTWNSVNLADVAVRLSVDGTAITLIGSSQQTALKWQMATVRFNAATGAYTASQLSGGDDNGIDKVTDLAIDESDNTYIIGSVRNHTNGYDLRVIKLNASLVVLWQDTYNGVDDLDDEGLSIELTSSNEVVVSGYTNTINEGKNFIVRKYNNLQGSLIWSKTYDADRGDDEATGLKLDFIGNPIICGSSYKDGNLDYCIQKLDAFDGTLIWTSRWNGDANGDDVPMNIAFSEYNNDIYVGGQSQDNNGRFRYVVVRWSQKNVLMPVPLNGFNSSAGYIDNRGQLRNIDGTSNSSIKFYCQRTIPSTYIDEEKISYQYTSMVQDSSNVGTLVRIDMAFTKGLVSATPYPMRERKEYANFYLGHMPHKAERTNLYDAIVKLNVYENIDLIFSNNRSGYCHWIVARNGSTPSEIAMEYSGQTGLSISSNGDLIIHTAIGDQIQPKPKAYEMNEVSGELTLLSWQPEYIITDNEISFLYTGNWVGTLVLECTNVQNSWDVLNANGNLDWSTFTGGTGFDQNLDVTSNEYETVWVTGEETNEVFSDAQGQIDINGNFDLQGDLFVAKFEMNCALTYFTVYGGSGNDRGWSITHNESDGVFVVGYTDSNDITNAVESGSLNDASLNGISDGLFLELNEFGIIAIDSYIGGDGIDFCSGVAYQWNSFQDTRDIWITGNGNSPENFPTQSYGLYNQPHAGGHDGFIMRLVGNERTLQWCTWFGSESDDFIGDVGIVTSDPIFVGVTKSEGYSATECDVPQDGLFPNCDNAGLSWQHDWFDISNSSLGNYFIGRFNDQTLGLHWSTFLGASPEYIISENKPGIATSSDGYTEESMGYVFVTGSVPEQGAATFPTHDTGFGFYNQGIFGGGNQDMFISRFRVVGSTSQLTWGTFVGGSKDENGFGLAIDSKKRIFVTGWVNSADMQADSSWCTVPTDNTFPLCNDTGLNYMETDEIGGTSQRAVVMGFDKDTKLLWSTEFGNGTNNVGRALSTGKDKLFLAGHSEQSWTTWEYDQSSNTDYFQPQLSLYRDGTIARFDIPTMLNDEIIETVYGNKLFHLYPNPAYQNISVVFENVWNNQNKLYMYNSMGQQVQEVILIGGAENTQIDVSHLCSGIYYIVLQTNQTTQSCTFVKE